MLSMRLTRGVVTICRRTPPAWRSISGERLSNERLSSSSFSSSSPSPSASPLSSLSHLSNAATLDSAVRSRLMTRYGKLSFQSGVANGTIVPLTLAGQSHYQRFLSTTGGDDNDTNEKDAKNDNDTNEKDAENDNDTSEKDDDGGPIEASSSLLSIPSLADVVNTKPLQEMTNAELAETSDIPGWHLIHTPPKERKDTPRGALVGRVVSTRMSKTVNVAVDRYRTVPVYRKTRRYTRKFMAHDEGEVCVDGDLVMIRPCQRISKRKHFVVHEIVRPKGEA